MDAHDIVATIGHKFEQVTAYSAHLRQVFRDKSILWSQRATSMSSVFVPSSPCDFLLICSDGIDQSHWALPRFSNLQTVKAVSNYKRPTCVVICVWAIGHLLRFWVLDQDQAHDSSTTIDCVARTIEEVSEKFEREGRSLPCNLIYWVMLAACRTCSFSVCTDR